MADVQTPLVMQLAERLFLASEVLGILAEREEVRRISKADIARMEAGQLPLPSEDEVQEQIVQGLRAYGYLVLVTSRRAKRCPKCGEYSHQGDGASKGLSDVLLRHPTWCAGMWFALEIKKPGPIKWSSDEQKQLAAAGDVIVVQSFEEALAAAHGFQSSRQQKTS